MTWTRRDAQDLIRYSIGAGDMMLKVNELLDEDFEDGSPCELSMASADKLLDWIVDQIAPEEAEEG